MNALDARRRLLGRNVYKKTVEGNPAIAQGSLARMYPGITMQGWTEQDSTTGAQLFDIDEFLELPLEPFASYGNARVLALTLKPNTNYTLSSNNIGAISGDVNKNRSLYFTTIDDMLIAAQSSAVFDGKPVTKTSDEEGKLKIVLIDRENADPIVNKEKWVMLNEGDTALPYEPYTGGQPSPNPDCPQEIVSAGKYDEATGKYQYQVKLTGANLFDYTDMLKEDGYVHSNFSKFGAISIKPFHVEQGKQYLLITKGSTVVTTDYSSIYFGQDDLEYFPVGGNSTKVLETGIGYSAFEDDKEKRILLTASRTCEITKCMVHGAGVSERYQVEEFGLLEYTGDINIPYEPYRTPQTVTLTSDRPLTKWDKLEKRNGQWGWVYKSNMLSVPKAGYIASDSLVKDRKYFRAENLVPDSKISSVPREGSQYCNIFNLGNPYEREENLFWIYRPTENKNGELRIGLSDTSIDTKELFEQYISDKDIYIWYETAEETFVPLSESEQEQMNELYTFRPTTVLSNDCECEMSLTYKTKKSLEVTT